ncbi:hypothetical protein IAR55_006332 [Kwoniella newhampshirensis]|uniref:Uncharacterized protein n=1 Tax=Kwoniella newhampshirensis TaxID=1651941 RepID=A0AAW0YGR6_9TREE
MTTSFTPFQRHLLHFAQSPTSPNITVSSALRGSLELGLNFPVSLSLALAIPLLYAPFPHYLRPVPIKSVQKSDERTQLSPASLSQSTYSMMEVFDLYRADHAARSRGWFDWMVDQGHVLSFWAIAADVKTGRVDVEDVERFQKGEWCGSIVKRRQCRMPGKGDVLPFYRGGPIIVGLHSWFVGRLFGVRVYEP